MPYAPTLTASATPAPCPRVEVLFAAFASGTATVTVYRLGGGREYRVRGAVRAAVAGSLTRVDYEIPFGVEVTYRAEMFTAAGLSLGFTDSAAITLTVADTWMHNPLDPAGAVRVAFRGNALRELRRPVQGSTTFPINRRVGVVIGGQRGGLRDVRLDIITDTLEQADAFANLVGNYTTATVPVLCIRVGAQDRIRLPRPFYASALDIAEVDIDYIFGGTKIAHQFVGDEVSPPAEAIIVPLLTRADVRAFYGTRAAVKAGNLSRLALNRRYEIAGTAP